MIKQISIFIGIILLIGSIILSVNAQPTGTTVSPRCNAINGIDVDYAYKIYTQERYTNYIAIITAGRCEREFRGTVNTITGLPLAISNDIRAQMIAQSTALYPDPFGNLDVDGRGFFTIP